MKLHKFVAACALALSLGGVAQATTIVHITGSTAFRKATVVAIEHLMMAGPGGGTYGNSTASYGTISAGGFKAAYNAATSAGGEQGDTYVVLQGTIQGANNPVIVKTAWAGSVGGLATVANSINVTWTAPKGYLDTSNLSTLAEATTVGDANIKGGYSSNSTSVDGDDQLAHITMSDSLQASAGYSSLIGAGSNATLSGKVGVVPFEFVASNGVTNTVAFSNCTATSGGSTINFGAATYLPTNSSANDTVIAALNGTNSVIGGPNLPFRNAVVSSITGNSTIGGVITLASATVNATITANSTVSGPTFVVGVSGVNPVNGITTLLAQQLLKNGGAYLSEFTGNSTDNGTAVYAMGRNFDSGTRLSEMAETSVGVFTAINAQMQPTFADGPAYTSQTNTPTGNAGKGGGANKYMIHIDKWMADNIYPAPLTKNYTIGGSGFNGGGDLAAALATPGCVLTTNSTAASKPLLFPKTGNHGGWLVGYLGWNDATAACKNTAGPNTAHRIAWNGQTDWSGTEAFDGSVTHTTASITEGQYSAWEYEFLYYSSSATADQITVASKIADQIVSTDAGQSGIALSAMSVSKSLEGGVITHN